MSSRIWMMVAAWASRALAVVALAHALVWVVGPTGTGTLFDQHVPSKVTTSAQWLNPEAFGQPSSPFLPADGYEAREVPGVVVSGEPFVGVVAPGQAEVVTSFRTSFLAPSGGQRLAWVLVSTVPSLLVAWTWWVIGGMAHRSHQASPFTSRNGRTLAGIGVAIATVALVQSVAGFWVRRWLLSTSTIGDVTTFPFSWSYLPWTALAVGVGLVVISATWRRGVTLERDVEGLV